jgi:ABC-type antimicrobial peptide transport system permease subunit
MTNMNTVLMILIAIGIGIVFGQFLFRQAGGSSRTVSTAIGTATGTFWVVVGIFMIVGGFYVGGVIVIMVAWYLARGNYREYRRERGMRARIANGR